MDLDVRAKALVLGALFLIVSPLGKCVRHLLFVSKMFRILPSINSFAFLVDFGILDSILLFIYLSRCYRRLLLYTNINDLLKCCFRRIVRCKRATGTEALFADSHHLPYVPLIYRQRLPIFIPLQTTGTTMSVLPTVEE
jgi:hypothetical protein